MRIRTLFIGSLLCFAAPINAGPELHEAARAYERGRYTHAYMQLLVAAEKGDPRAQEMLGFMYAFGPHLYPGLQRDLRTAAAWFARAGANASPAARYIHCAIVRKVAARDLAALSCFDD